MTGDEGRGPEPPLSEDNRPTHARDSTPGGDPWNGAPTSDPDGTHAARAKPVKFGHFRILRLIGEGGMGAVYEAEQDSPRRRVALKVLRTGFGSPSLIRRFEREAEILGRLQHPGIAQIFEAGFAAPSEGLAEQPYYAMELLQGVSLTHHCKRNQLPIRARVEILARACDAVQHAHDRGIVHRDLKPENIIVLADGQPKVLDFGIARDLMPGPAPSLHTGTGQLVGTLPYMSPEQVAGRNDAIDARTDTWALGVIAFELLTGRLPHDLDRHAPPEAMRLIQEEDPQRLGSIDRTLRGDLDTIVAKALEKDPERRYARAGDLAADLRRWLADEPVSARPPSAAYQLAKFARRNKVLVGGVAATLIALLLGTSVAVRQAIIARRSEREALGAAYRAGLAAASAALLDDDTPTAVRRLEETPPAMRGWEWSYIEARLDDSELALAGPESPVIHVAPAGTGWLAISDGMTEGRADHDAWAWRPDGSVRTAPRSMEERPVRAFADEMPELVKDFVFKPGEAIVSIVDAESGQELAAYRPCIEGRGLTALSAGVPPHPVFLAPIDTTEPGVMCDLATGRVVHEFPTGKWGWPACSTTDGRLIAFPRAQLATVTDADTGTLLASLKLPIDDVSGIAFSPDGEELAMGTLNSTIHVWRWRTGEHRERAAPRTGHINDIAWSPDGRLIATAHSDWNVRIWEADLSRPRGVLRGLRASVETVSFAQDGASVAAGAFDGSVLAWSTATLDDPSVLRGHESYIYPVAVGPDSDLAVSGSWDGTARTWSLLAARPLATFRPEPALPGMQVLGVALGPDGRTLATSLSEGSLLTWDLASGRELRRAHVLSGPLGGIAYAQDGASLVAPVEASVRAFDARDLSTLWTQDEAFAFAVPSADGTRIAARGRPGVLVLDARDGRVLLRTEDDERTLGALAWSPDGARIAGGSSKGRVAIWSARDGAHLKTIAASPSKIYTLAWSPDGSRIAVGGEDGVVRLLDPGGGDVVVELRGHASYVYSLAWTPDGRTLVSGSGDATVRSWTTRRLAEIARERVARDAGASVDHR